MKYKFLITFFCTCLWFVCQAQNITEAAARAELQKRGYDETRFREELTKKGINIDAVDRNNPAEVAKVEQAVKEVMAILDAEKNAGSSGSNTSGTSANTGGNNPNPPVPQSKIDDTRSVDKEAKVANQSKEIQKAVKEGATIEEAVAEKIQESSSKQLPTAITYGQHIFRDKSIQLYRTAEDAKPSKAYVLGPGDKISISIWGPTQENFALEIEKDGYIQPTGMPRYYLAGLTIEAAEKLMASRLRSYYYFQNENFELNVTTARTINVNIVGEVFNNGVFNISAINNAFNALIAAGGPNDLGSVRKIQVLRTGKKPLTLDVYQYLQNPIIGQSYYLSDNDHIFVPVAQKLVTINGAVNRSFRYELLENEHLFELIKFAGGLKYNAYKNNIKIKRIEGDTLRIIDVDLTSLEKANKNYTLNNGDLIEISAINEIVKNEVNISGGVENPGPYAIGNNEKISDLINKGKLLEGAITTIAYLKRLNDDQKTIRYEFVNIGEILNNPKSDKNLTLKNGDELIISLKSAFVDTYFMDVQGAVRNPTQIKLDQVKNLKISDAIFFAGGLKDDATDFAYIFRTRLDDFKTQEYIEVNLREALDNPDSKFNLNLEPKDRLVVYSKNTFTDESFIRVAGAVRSPGEFLYNPSLKLKDVMLLAGGLKREASSERIDVYRLEFDDEKATRVLAANIRLDENYNIKNGGDNFELQPFDQIFVRTAPEFELQRNVTVSGEIKYPGTYALMSDNTKLATIIREAGGVTEEAFLKGATLFRKKDDVGYIIVDIEKAIKNPKSFENVILQEGDVISLPKLSNLVTITGATKAYEMYPDKIVGQNKLQVPYQPNKSAKYYIYEYAGGLSKDAAHNKITVVDASGKIVKPTGFLFFKKYPKVGPGSEIRVGYKDVKVKEEKGKKDEDVKWGDILANSIAQATAILSIILLVQNVN